jgi:L-threonate 2-dehydrogenase
MDTGVVSFAIVGTGETGQGMARALLNAGATVHTCVAGRSERTIALAHAAAIPIVPTFDELVASADIFLSIVPPASALDIAREVARAERATAHELVYMDCNAIAPQTVRNVAAIVGGSGGRRGHHRRAARPLPHNACVRLGPGCRRPRPAGRGRQAARPADRRRLRAEDVLLGDDEGHDRADDRAPRGGGSPQRRRCARELLAGMPQRKAVDTLLPRAPWVAHRYVGEMEEVAATFRDIGLISLMLEGAAALFSRGGRDRARLGAAGNARREPRRRRHDRCARRGARGSGTVTDRAKGWLRE